jgi:DNA polymerase III epsilon subunit-like protein
MKLPHTKYIDQILTLKSSYTKIKPIKLIVLDTETATSGEVIQLAYNIYLYYPEINYFVCVSKYDWLIDEKINKVDFYGKFTLRDIRTKGEDPHYVFSILSVHLEDIDYIVGHNIKFDTDKLVKYFTKLKINYKMPTPICTMRASKDHVGLTNSKGWAKFPKLCELYEYYYGTVPDQTKTHTADYDIHLTFLCFQALHTNKFVKIE